MSNTSTLLNALQQLDQENGSNWLKDWNRLNRLHEGLSEAAAMAHIGLSGEIQEVNKAFEELLGYSNGELYQMTMHELSRGCMTDEVQHEMNLSLNAGKIWQGEVCKKHKKGHTIWLSTFIIPFKEKEKVSGFVSLYFDAAKSKKLIKERGFYFEILNLSSDAIQVGDRDGNIVFVNQKSVHNLGMSKAEIIGKKVWEVEKIFSNVEDWQMHMEEVKSRKQGLLIDGYNVRGDGTIFPVEVNARYLSLDGEGFIVANIRDASKRKEQVMELQKAQQLLYEAQRIAEVASFEMKHVDANVEFSENAWRVFGMKSYSDFSYNRIGEIIHPDDQERVDKMWRKFLEHGSLFQTEYRVLDHRGEINYIQSIVRSYKDALNKNQRYIGTVQNITKTIQTRMELEERTRELEQRNRDLDQFAQIVSHDLKSPLRAIHNLSDWLQDSLKPHDDNSAQHLELLKKRVERMERLINGILHYSSAGKHGEDKKSFDSGVLVKEILDNLQLVHPTVQITMQGEFPELMGKNLILEQVITNLADNAMKHNTSDLKKLIVAYTWTDKQHVFSITDNGPGIDPRFHKRIFEMFQTLSSKDSMNTGVGLAIVSKLCMEWGWELDLKSELGRGSTFSVSIPIR